jgi:hypothetical protein
VGLDLVTADKAFPVIIRYMGMFTTLVLIGFCLAGYYVQAAPGFVAAGGMILYKSVRDAANADESSKGRNDDLSDW